ncbi:MoaD/ThiS family protein [Microbacterium sp.]|uniref:MoaD/ThiS family protein n=1 Tax=Microbacterium sp. TaxID=51671 RepID=UPI003A855156
MARVRYFAAAEDLAGTAEESRGEATVAALLAALSTERPGLGAILPRCAVLVDGSRSPGDTPLAADTVVDVLPPFAGG